MTTEAIPEKGANLDDLLDERHRVLYQVQISAVYHRTEEKRFEKYDKWTKFVSVAFGGAALSAIMPNAVKPYLIAIISLASAATLVFGVSEKSRKHADYASQYGNLEADIQGVEETACTAGQVAKWRSRLASLEAVEPLTNEKLVLACQHRIDKLYIE